MNVRVPNHYATFELTNICKKYVIYTENDNIFDFGRKKYGLTKCFGSMFFDLISLYMYMCAVSGSN